MNNMNGIWPMNLPTIGSSIWDKLKCGPKNWEVFTKYPLLLITEQYAFETKADVASSLFHSLPALTFMP